MIRKMLDLSTAHFLQSTLDDLWDGVGPASLAVEVGGDPAFVVLHIPDDRHEWSTDLAEAADYAVRQGCHFLKIDRDGDMLAGLPTYR